MKENKEETKLQSEQKTAEEILAKYYPDGFNNLEDVEITKHCVLVAMKDFASQFKSQLPIEQKNELELIIAEKNIDIIHLRDRIKELESQHSTIEGVERYTEIDLKMAFDAGRDHEYIKEYGSIERYNATTFKEWLATRKGSKSGE